MVDGEIKCFYFIFERVEVPKEGDGLSEMIESARKSIEFDLQLTKSPNSENELSEQDR